MSKFERGRGSRTQQWLSGLVAGKIVCDQLVHIEAHITIVQKENFITIIDALQSKFGGRNTFASAVGCVTKGDQIKPVVRRERNIHRLCWKWFLHAKMFHHGFCRKLHRLDYVLLAVGLFCYEFLWCAYVGFV